MCQRAKSPRAGECAGTEAAYGCALPETVIDVTGVEHGLFCAGVFERLADGTLPGSFGDVVIGVESGGYEGEWKCYIADEC